MRQITWDDFNYKNRNKTGAFENLCRVLFLRSIKHSGTDYQYNYNQAGLEIEPVLTSIDGKGKWVGAQCKYFSTENNTSQYKQIFDSVELAIKKYKGRLDYIYIYANSTLQPICTDDEIAKAKKKSARIKLAIINRKTVKLVWLQQDNILDLVQEASNSDLRRIYFSDERETDWIENGISVDEKTFLNSTQFFNLKLNNIAITDLYPTIFENKVSLLLGPAGTGKSILIKKMYSNISDEFLTNEIAHDVPLPILIKLRECINGNLESLLRQRLNDYNLNNTESTCDYIYFFDGLDEVSHHNIGSIVNQIIYLMKMSSTKSIIISSRTDSNNLSYLHQFVQCNEHKIDALTYDDIETIFVNKGEQSKLEKLKQLNHSNAKILNDITDIFSVDLLWNIIDKADINITKIEIIEQFINYCFSNYSKIAALPLLEPKSKSIIELCTEISYNMQTKLHLNLELSTVQNIVMNLTGMTNAGDINEIVNALIDLFFESSHSDIETMISYKHRRFHEYFLYKKIDDNFLNSPNLLRELHLLSNKEFVINVFLKTSLIKAYKDKDILKALSLRLMQQYLGYSYWHEYADDIIGKDFSYGSKEPVYSYSPALVLLLAHYNSSDIEALLNNDELSISDCITKDNCLELIELHNRLCNGDIVEFIFNKYDIQKDKVVNHRNFYSYLYILNQMRNVPLQKIYNDYFKKPKFLYPEIGHMDYVDSSNEILNAFYKYCLDQDIDFIAKLIPNMSKEQLEILSFQLLRHDHILCLISKTHEYSDLRFQFLNRIEKEDENYMTNTIAAYSFLSGNIKNHEQLKDALTQANCRNYPAWHRNIELHNMLCYILKDEVNYSLSEFKLGVQIFTHLVDNYDNLDNVLMLWIEDIKPYNFVWNDWLQYTYSNMIGVLISKIGFDVIKLKSFFRELMKYDSVIYINVVYYTILKHNPKLFHEIINKQIINKMIDDSMVDDLEFENSCEFFFQYAAMFWNIDKEKSYALLIDGINNELLRPPYKGDQLMSMIMPGCLFFAYQNYLYNDNIIKDLFTQLYSALTKLSKSTQNDSPFSFFKWAMRICVGEENIPNDLYDISETALYLRDNEKVGNDVDISKITQESLIRYYTFEIEKAPYDSLEFWQQVINMNYELDKELSILYNAFDKCFPSMYGYAPIIDYIHLPVAVLLSDERTKNKFVDYIMSHSGEYAFYNIIRAYSIIGNADEAKDCIDFLYKYVDMLTAPISLSSKNDMPEKSLFIMDLIYNTSRSDWEFFENKNTCVLKRNPEIKIMWDDYEDREEFRERWATKHPDQHAYIYDYIIYNNDIEIKRFALVDVDGYRATLPLPKANTNVIKRNDYYLARLFNNRIETLHSYIIISGLIVE